jgi:hypothetical protein
VIGAVKSMRVMYFIKSDVCTDAEVIGRDCFFVQPLVASFMEKRALFHQFVVFNDGIGLRLRN